MSNAATARPVKQRSNHKAEAAIRVRIYDFAGLEPVVLADAQKVTKEIFRKAGVETVWLDCPVDQAHCAEEPERLQFMLRILSTAMKKDIVAEDENALFHRCPVKAYTNRTAGAEPGTEEYSSRSAFPHYAHCS